MQVTRNLPTTDIYDNYIKSEALAIPYDNNCTYHLPNGGEEDMVYFQYEDFKGIIKYAMKNNDLHLSIAGHIDGGNRSGETIDYIAANPIDRRYSYSGSGLPFPNAELAYEGTTNKGTAVIDDDGDFQIEVEYPNAYYVRQGSILLNPHVYLYLKSIGRLYTLDVGRPVQNRSLTGLPDRYSRTTMR